MNDVKRAEDDLKSKTDAVSNDITGIVYILYIRRYLNCIEIAIRDVIEFYLNLIRTYIYINTCS